jgi:hypothetical protein
MRMKAAMLALAICGAASPALGSLKVRIPARREAGVVQYSWMGKWLSLKELEPKLVRRLRPDPDHTLVLSPEDSMLAADSFAFLEMLRKRGYKTAEVLIHAKRQEPPITISVHVELCVTFADHSPEQVRSYLSRLDQARASAGGMVPAAKSEKEGAKPQGTRGAVPAVDGDR